MRLRIAFSLSLACLASLFLASPAAAAEERLFLGPLGAFTVPKGLTVDQKSHDVYAIGGRNEQQTITIAATAGKFRLEFEGKTTAKELNFNAGASEVRDALREIACGGASCLSTTGGPGDGPGSKPYVVGFGGPLASTDVEQIKCVAGSEPLSGGSGCTVTTTRPGVNGSVTRYHADGTPSEFTALGSNSIDGLEGPDLTSPKGLHFNLANRSQVAIDESGGETSGEIYVTVTEDHKVDIFAANGEHLGELTQFEETPGNEATLKPLGLVCGAAVDGAGSVYVADLTNGIHKYTPSGAVVANGDNVANFTTVSQPCGLAAGRGPTAGSVFGIGEGKLFKLDATTGELEYGGKPISEGNTAVSVDPSSGHVLAAAGVKIEEWDAAGESAASSVGTIAAGSATAGVAVDGSTGKGGTVYVARANVSHLDVYGPYVQLPVVVTKPATQLSGATATLNGTISADNGPAAECHFQYILKASFAAQKKAAEEESAVEPKRPEEITEAAFAGAGSAECEPKGPFEGASINEVSGEAEGLDPEAEYEFRIVGENENGQVPGAELEFETLGKPQVQGASASHVTTASAQIDAEVNPRGLPTSFTVQYVTRQQFEESEFAQATTVTGPKVPGSVSGSGDLSAAAGTGDLAEGFSEVKDLKTAAGAFAVGQIVSGSGIKAGTTVSAVGAGTLTLSQPADASGGDVALAAGSKVIANLTAGAGRFGAGQAIEGAGIAPGTTIAAVGEGELTLSKAVTAAGTGVALAASGFQPVTLQLSGLAPDSAYRFRAAVENGAGEETETQAHAFATRPPLGAALLDGRAYELVSPAQRMGEVYALEPSKVGGGSCELCTPGWNNQKAPMQSSPSGEAVAFEGDPFAAGLASEANSYVARRGEGSWATSALSEPQFDAQDFKAFSPDLSKAILLQSTPALTPQAPADFANLYLREEGGALATMITSEPPNRVADEESKELFKIHYAGANAGTEASPAFSHVVFEANDALTPKEKGIAPAAPEVSAEENDLYEWSGGQLHLVSVLPGNESAAANAAIGSGDLLSAGDFDFEHAISADGSRVFWSALPSGQLYLREGGTTTTEIPDHAGRFLTASADGAKVLLSDGMLYDLEDLEAPVDLSGGAGGFEGIAGASEDLSRIYFVDTEALTGPEEENANEEAATKGAFNLYLWEGGAVRFIAILDPFDNSSNLGQLGVWHAAAGNRLAQASADGRFLAFQAKAAPTGYDNTVREAQGCRNSGKKAGGEGVTECFEVFEYDAVANTLSCASCNPSGERPTGSSTLQLIFAHEEFFAQPANLPAAGEGRLFFESLDALVAGDTNGRVGDVYEFEPNGVGDCKRAKGCLGLVSSGHGPKDSQFISASASGNDVFFTTRERLVGRDRNDLMDLYDARVNGGQREEGEPAPCEGEACRGPVSAPPGFAAPSSAQVQGEGPLSPPHCRRGFVRRGGKCVRRHKHKHKHRHRKAAKQRGGSR